MKVGVFLLSKFKYEKRFDEPTLHTTLWRRLEMHIPDGYLSPISSAAMYGITFPFWYIAARRVKTTLKGRTVPVLAIFSALAFTLMMFIVPVPGGSTAHPVGGTLLAIVVGPWAAVIGVSVALLIQALLFGDGGIMAFGVNAFNAAIILPFVGIFVYRMGIGEPTANFRRSIVLAAIGSYIAINIMALVTALELGSQPLLFHTEGGVPSYFPFDWKTTIPAMMVPHLLVIGPVEAIVTGLVLAYLKRTYPGLLPYQNAIIRTATVRSLNTLWVGLAIVVVLTPLGLLATGPGLTERVVEDLEKMGWQTLPRGLEKFSTLWRAPLTDYTVLGIDARLGYLATALIGVMLITLGIWVIAKLGSSKKAS